MATTRLIELQHTQNSLAQAVLPSRFQFSSHQLLRVLQWLPITACIDFKLVILFHVSLLSVTLCSFHVIVFFQALKLIRPVECLQWHAVSSVVNNSRNDTEACIRPFVPEFVSFFEIFIALIFAASSSSSASQLSTIILVAENCWFRN